MSQALEHHDIRLEDVVNATGISYGTLWRRTHGIGKAFDIDELAAIAGLVGMTVAELMAFNAEAVA